MAIVELKNVTRVYKSGDHELKALDGVNISLDEGKFVVILGPSGAGKSTLLNMLGGLDSPTSGVITVNGKDISALTRDELADYRAVTVGFVFQFYNLIPTLTVLGKCGTCQRDCTKRSGCRKKSSRKWGWPIICIISLQNFPAVSSSVSQLPARWPKIQRYFSVMSRRALWIRKQVY